MAIPEVGSQDPTLPNSPILGALAGEEPAPEMDETLPLACQFNGDRYTHGSYVRSGDTFLRCEHGVWTDIGPTAPEAL